MLGVLLCCLVHQARRGPPRLGSYSVDRHVRHLKGHTRWGPTLVQCIRHLMASLSTVQLPMLPCGEREAMVVVFHLLRVTQQYHLAFMAARPSSSGISHYSLLPHIPSICLSAVKSSPCSGIAPQSLNSISQPLCLPGDWRPCPGYVWLWQGLSDSHTI